MAAVLAVSLPAAAPALAAGNGTVRVTPAAQPAAGPGSTFTVQVISNADTATSGIQATVTYDKSLLQVTGVTRPAGSAWGTAASFFGSKGDLTSAPTMQQQIAEANGLGSLSAASFFDPPTTLAASADQVFLNITFIVIGSPAAGTTTTPIGLPTGPSDTALNDGNGDPVAITTTGSVVTPCQSGAGNTTTQIRAPMDAGFLEITVPQNVTIPLIRLNNNAVTFPVSVYSDGTWTLNVSDAMPAGKLAGDRGRMTDGIPATKRLTSPMQAQVAPDPIRTLDQPTASTNVLSGASTATPLVTLFQNVGPTDPGGSYGIGLLITATSGF
jgi:hypothetical protein